MSRTMADKILILGVDGMDPRIAKHFMDNGKMPNLKKYVEQGAARENLQLLGAHPTVTPPMWTTLATGAYPQTHGITDYHMQSKESLDTETLITHLTLDYAKQNNYGTSQPKLAWKLWCFTGPVLLSIQHLIAQIYMLLMV